MTTKELIEELKKYPEDTEVLTYVEEAEEFGETDSVELITNQDEMPYSKGDTPEIRGTQTLLIRGWIAS